MTRHEAIADMLHSQGYSCSQAVLGAFSDVVGVDQKMLFKLAAGFGGGIADMREVCGAVIALAMVVDLVYAEGAPDGRQRAANDYPRLRELAEAFRRENGSIVCRELLGMNGTKRVRPLGKTCHDMVCDTARLVDAYLEAHPANRAGN